MAEIVAKIDGITSEHNQIINIPLNAFGLASVLKLTINYIFTLKKWFCNIDIIDVNNVLKSYGKGVPLLTQRPLLNQSSNILPFDLYIITSNGLNPSTEDAFVTGNASGDNSGLFLINQELKKTIFGDI